MRAITPAERAHWPEYCPQTQTYHEGGNAAYQRWIDRLGMGFSAMHHYCWGIIKAYRASTLSTQSQFRNGLLADAIREVEYVDQNIPQDFLLRPEVMLRGGQWAAKLDDQVRAFQFFEASIRAKPDYWPAYLELANLNLSIKRREEAIDALKRGLEQAPGQAALAAALARIEADLALGTQRAQRPAR